jgi:hypothetical protein
MHCPGAKNHLFDGYKSASGKLSTLLQQDAAGSKSDLS